MVKLDKYLQLSSSSSACFNFSGDDGDHFRKGNHLLNQFSLGSIVSWIKFSTCEDVITAVVPLLLSATAVIVIPGLVTEDKFDLTKTPCR